ncbi:hypothetical protein D9757_001297 [Collybiopsis confluens]|uniref:Urease accessory protein UreF n=1 Tax=Collybiopsis confluens TaxID=2823264 RepID=A0A8H5MG37_9AGAR|nr:hypothetical protein D9757_001297 [Collybiopsis confluens]
MTDDNDETYILLLLSDSNLPTGSFVASSGFESYVKHGFPSTGLSESRPNGTQRTLTFMRNSITAYARNALPFISDVHRAMGHFLEEIVGTSDVDPILDVHLKKLQELDELYDVMTLNHVTKRASRSQGVALLTLYSKGFSMPSSSSAPVQSDRVKDTSALVARYKTLVRAQDASGHLPICWGILTGALGLKLDRAQYLHIFLHARSLLSASVRINEIGPYNAQQILLHLARPIIEAEVEKCRNLRTGNPLFSTEGELDFDETIHGPANTWPLGEIIAARHDLQHSRVFNS